MSEEEKKEEVQIGEEAAVDDGPQVSDLEEMTPEEREGLLRGDDPEPGDGDEPGTPGEDPGTPGDGDPPSGEDVPGKPLSDEDLKKLSPEDPAIPDAARQRHPALREERRKRRQTEAQNKKLEKQISKMGEDFEELKVGLEKGAQPPSDPASGAHVDPDFLKLTQDELDNMTPGQYYDRFNQEWQRREKALAASIIEELEKRGVGGEPESDPPPAFTFDDDERQHEYGTSIDLTRAGVSFSNEEVEQIKDRLAESEDLYLNITADDSTGKKVSFQVFDQVAMTAMDVEGKSHYGDELWHLMWANPDAQLPETDPLRAGGLLNRLSTTDYPAYLAILAAPDPIAAMGVKFKEIYEKTGGTLKLPPKAAPKPTVPVVDEDPDPVGLSPGSTTGGAIQGSGTQVNAEGVSTAALAGMTKEQRDQAIREGVIDVT